MKKVAWVLVASSLAVFPALNAYSLLTQLQLQQPEVGATTTKAGYVIITEGNTTIVRVPNQKRETRKQELKRKREKFLQLDAQLAILDKQRTERGTPPKGVFGRNLKAMSGRLLVGSPRE